MKMLTWMFLFSFLALLSSCEVKEKAASGALIAGHAPTTNAFTLHAPAAATLVAGDSLTLTLTFPYVVTVTGTPTLGLTIGASSKSANFTSGSGSKTLIFTYTVAASDNDGDGITVTGLSLNGGTMTFSNRGIITNCSTTLASKNFSNVLIDNEPPTITAFALSNFPGFYRLGDTLSFLLTFSEPVIVTGSPRFQVSFNTGGSVYATYAGGTGTTVLSFTYTISNTVADTNGYVIASTIDLNSGSISDLSATAATLTFPSLVGAVQTYSATVDFDGRLPYVVTVIPPANGSYAAAQNLDITLLFNRPVNVTGNPYIGVTIGSTLRQVPYFSGSGTNTLVFRYTTVPGDVDVDGITIAPTIVASGGTITGASAPTVSYFANASNNVLSIPNTSGVLCGAIQPQPLSVTRNIDNTAPVWGASPDNTWIIGQQLYITVGFNTGITVNQSGGIPRIPLTIGSTSKYANYLSGGDGQTSIVFSYTIAEGDLDLDGSIAIGDIDLNGGTMTDASLTNTLLTLPTAALSTTSIDGVRPVISVIAPPADATYSNVNVTSMNFEVEWSEPVDYSSTAAAAAYIGLIIGGSTINAVYSSGDQTDVVTHIPVSLGTTNDIDGSDGTMGITLNSPFAGTATIRDRAGNTATVLTFTPPVTTGVLVDTSSPSVLSVNSPPAGRYNSGDDLDFELNFSESVNVGTAGGAPYIQIRVGSNTRNAYVTSPGTGSSHTFRYTVVASDTDPDYVEYFSSNITIPASSYIRDMGLNNLTPLTFSDPTWTGVEVDEVAPAISSASTTAGIYVSGADGVNNAIAITTTFSEAVVVDIAGGSPSITLDMATGPVSAVYHPGSSTPTALAFTYAVNGAVDMDLDGLSLGAASIQLNGGTIKDSSDNDANLSIGTVTNIGNVIVAPHATVWMRNAAVTNLSGFSTKPTITTNAPTGGGAFNFDGSSYTMSLDTNPLGAVHALYMAIRTPAAADTFTQNLLALNTVTLDASIDVTTAHSATLNVSSGYSGSGTTHATAMAANSLQKLEFIFGVPANLPTSPLIPADFSGDIFEIIIFESALSPDQQAHAWCYLNSNCP